MASAQQGTSGSPDIPPADAAAIDVKHTYVDQVRVRYGFAVIFFAFVLVGVTVFLSVYFFFSANEAVAVIGTVTGMVAGIVSTWFGISSANSVANRALSGQANAAATASTPAPSVTSVSPTSAPAGAEVTITGTGFTGATAVTFGGIASVDMKVISDVKITADAPEGKNPSSSSGVDVVVVGPSGSLSAATSGAKFAFKGMGVGRLDPNHGKSGEMIAILGSGFTSAACATYVVKFDATSVPGPSITFVDESKIHVVVPTLPAGVTPPAAVIVTVADPAVPSSTTAGHAQAIFIFD